jgi:ribosomal protein S2
MSTEHLDELRRRLAERTDQDSVNDRVTTDRLVAMRRRLSELERTSENSNDEIEVMAAEQEAHEIMNSLENVRDLRSSPDG